MSWDELRRLASRHVIGAHTRSHCRLAADTMPKTIEEEVAPPKRILEQRLGHPVHSFCWVGGEEHAITAEAASQVRSAGYRCAFMTASTPITPDSNPHQLHRTHIEADWPLSLVRFQLCGLADRANAAKRKRIAALLRSPS